MTRSRSRNHRCEHQWQPNLPPPPQLKRQRGTGHLPKSREVDVKVGFWDNPHLNGAQTFIPPRFKSPDPVIPGMVMRTSTRWFRSQGWSTVKRPLPVAYVENSGKISMSQLATWNCYPEQLLVTYVATIYQRLKKIIVGRHGFKDFRMSFHRLCFMAASLHAILHDNWIIDRFLGISRSKSKKSRKGLKNLLNFVLSHLGDSERFVYNQINYQILWLTLRGKKPRDKPRKELYYLVPPKQLSQRGGKTTKQDYPSFMQPACTWKKVEWRAMNNLDMGSDLRGPWLTGSLSVSDISDGTADWQSTVSEDSLDF